MVRLATTIEQGFASLRREMEMDREHGERRHMENRERLDGINGKLANTRERVSVLEAQFVTLSDRVEVIGRRTHELMNQAQTWISEMYERMTGHHPPQAPDEGDADKDVMTGSRIKWALWIFCGGFGACAALMKLMGKL